MLLLVATVIIADIHFSLLVIHSKYFCLHNKCDGVNDPGKEL